MARKRVQLDHLKEYDDAVVALKTKVKESEGQDMREAIQDKVRDIKGRLPCGLGDGGRRWQGTSQGCIYRMRCADGDACTLMLLTV